MSHSDYPIPTIDNPPTFAEPEYQSSIGRAVDKLRQGKRIPMDEAQDLMDQGFDLPSLEARYSRSNA